MYRRHRKANLWKYVFIGIVLIIIISGYYWSHYQYAINTPVNATNTKTIYFTIKKGESANQIAKQLTKNNLISDSGSFSLYTRLNHLDTEFKPGRYPLSQSLTVPEITATLSSNKYRQVIITIPEGDTVYDIDQILINDGLIQGGEFINAVNNYHNYSKYKFLNQSSQQNLIHPLEGYLFPDTYFVNPNNFSSAILIDLMLKNFKHKIAGLIPAHPDHTLSNTIIVASMIEKEANNNIDRKLISGIIWKRLDQHWALGIDAPLLYLKKDRTINYQDLQKNSPYNTRKNPGLPPGPIDNPGLNSIKAAFKPTNSPYYYYLTSKNGKMIYAKTNNEHNANKAKYLY